MSDDRRLNIRASLYPLIEAAAARRHVPVASFVAMVLSEYLLKHDELNSVKPTSVAPKKRAEPEPEYKRYGFDAPPPPPTTDPDAIARQLEDYFDDD